MPKGVKWPRYTTPASSTNRSNNQVKTICLLKQTAQQAFQWNHARQTGIIVIPEPYPSANTKAARMSASPE
ncbi:unnamed protein product [Nezara viridula]|uniref:Uncharacterized protein n=1 Tax=Nezara viridula TaxID=85310 RepID=A0A9P0E7E3_NEZVI|nr:unnamed protein product [Nezara viridula]